MNKKEAENICLKYLNNQASNAEIEQLLGWIETPENLKLFNDYIAINYYLNYKYKKADTAKAYKKALFMQDKKRKKNTFFTYMMAASIALLISVTLFYNKNKNGLDLTTKKPIIVNNTIKPGADKAVLTLEDGVSISLEKGIKYKNATVNSNGEELIYNNTSKINKLAYNYLTIPRGGQFSLTLSDGTKVWINSESKLKYPVSFKKGKVREVELIYGEAYFNVSPSSNHQGSAFKVHSKNQLIEVLGTEFNIKAYNNETQVFTTLVEGSVKVKANKATAILHPNEQAITNNYANKIQIKKVVASNLVSWYKGVFNFKSMPLKEIMKALSRWYDLEYEFKNSTIEKERFTGVIKKDQSIEEIAEMLKSAGFIKNYQIKNKKITLE